MSAGRSRLARLAESAGRPAPLRRPRPARPGSPAPRRTAVACSFDTGDTIAVHTVADTPLAGTVTKRWTVVPGAVAGRAAVPEAEVGTVGVVPAAPEDSPPRGSATAGPSLQAAPGAIDQISDLSGSASGPATEDVAGWTVTAPDEPDDEAFAQDIQAILAHAHSVAAPTPRMPLPDVPQVPPTPVPAAPQLGVGVTTGHDVFDRMAAANTPSRFDQGPVSLSVDFTGLDRALADESTPTTPPAAPTQPAAAGPAATSSAATQPAPSQPPATVVPPSAPSPPTSPTPPPPPAFKVTTDAPLVPQGPGLSCHAAACASMVAWRDEVLPDAAAVAGGTGYWERYAAGRTATYPDVFESFDVETALAGADASAPSTATALRDLLGTHGPLFVATFPPAEHAVVVAGITSDGTNTGVRVDVVDPWAVGMTTYAAPNPGSTSSIPLAELGTRLGAGPQHQLLVAHLRKRSL
ncbi:hypothetical protein IU486_31200 [Streptomyces gardneri]|uniref:papain-like cysteine protease family protein n=1 Tax=Nocardia abscessus TaxID=120957 RepID=UPI0018945F18|nr:papain-like cysteine protease family protein [Nocardia abscessus]MBF6169170.1 hypothetical protein [Streptomyces gardneri]MBF6475254.1 hypothetical protein [Nocardia abscessus]